MDVMEIRRRLMIGMVGSSPKVESGTFTLLNDEKTYTINHNLGVVPDFCIIYPIDVPTTSNIYTMCYQCILRIGQEDYNISTKETENAKYLSPHANGYGVSYNVNTPGTFTGTGKDGYAGTATDTTFIVGGTNGTNGGGSLAAGTYGYIIGKVL